VIKGWDFLYGDRSIAQRTPLRNIATNVKRTVRPNQRGFRVFRCSNTCSQSSPLMVRYIKRPDTMTPKTILFQVTFMKRL